MLLYNFVIRLYSLIIRLASLKNEKAALWVNGRVNWRSQYKKRIAELGNARKIWFHCASYGEFEQGRSLIEAIKNKYPDQKIIISFFSPSGYESFKSWKGADFVCYLPSDTPGNAIDFINIINPQTAIFIKYEFWVNYLFQLKKHEIQTYLVSAVFKPHHPFFKWYGGVFKRSLSTFNFIDVQDGQSKKLLESIGVKNVRISGDTRFDRVISIKNKNEKIDVLENFSNGLPLFVAGSTWPKDDEFIIRNLASGKLPFDKIVLVPHEVDKSSIQQLINLLSQYELSFVKYSEFQNNTINHQVLVIDTIGLLSKIYRYANVAYVGGGFDDGWHNVLEPSVYGIPVILFGVDEGKFNEITELIKMKTIGLVTNDIEFVNYANEFYNSENLKNEINNKLALYFNEKSNATARVLEGMNLY
ncbi:MAG: 3-deoxy-D-manno-octulosonic acid transferase [Sphingobacteriaceae bacterium]|nr:3-deoxy-D-manno-octulosonic acid transferase [Sphingobacteriaceae bacterium]